MSGQGKEHLKVMLRHTAIQKRVREIGKQITKDYRGQRVHLIGVLKGASIFLADLVRTVELEVSLDFMAVSSYGKGTRTSGEVKLSKDLDTSIEGLNVILVEDILDTGLTLGYLCRVLKQRKPKDLRIAALLDKPDRQSVEGSARGLRGISNPERICCWIWIGLCGAISEFEGCVRAVAAAGIVF